MLFNCLICHHSGYLLMAIFPLAKENVSFRSKTFTQISCTWPQCKGLWCGYNLNCGSLVSFARSLQEELQARPPGVSAEAGISGKGPQSRSSMVTLESPPFGLKCIYPHRMPAGREGQQVGAPQLIASPEALPSKHWVFNFQTWCQISCTSNLSVCKLEQRQRTLPTCLKLSS